jgi:hypothetical protein
MNTSAFVVSVKHANGHFSKYVVCADHKVTAEELVMARQRGECEVAWVRPMMDSDVYECRGD